MSATDVTTGLTALLDKVIGMSATGGTVVLPLVGDVDALTVDGFRTRAEALLKASELDRLVLDLGGVTTIDSSGLGLLVQLHGLARDRSVAMVLTNVPPRADALLKRTGLDRVFDIESRSA